MSTTELLVDGVRRLLDERCTPDAVRAVEGGKWSDTIWSAVSEVGLPWISVPEEAGGVGGELADALRLMGLVGAAAVPVPVPEVALLGGWLLARAGLAVPEAPITVPTGCRGDRLVAAPSGSGVRLDGALHRVPWARHAERIVALVDVEGGLEVVSIAREQCTLLERCNVAGEARDDVVLSGAEIGKADHAAAPDDVTPQRVRVRGALARAVQMAGAMDRVRSMTVEYANERTQFGRPIARFQAVKRLLVELAAEAALAKMASDAAIELFAAGDGDRASAVAKIVADRATTVVTANAHQVHGAMGVTQEHDLQLLTRRLWAWSSEFGSGRDWARELGRDLLTAGADALWPAVVSGLVDHEAPSTGDVRTTAR